MKKRLALVSLGCSKNLVDSELMLGILKNTGYEIITDCKKAQIIVVNTCGFIKDSIQESINKIIEMAEHKKLHCQLLIVAGCLAQRYQQVILDEIPEVDAVLGTGSYALIAHIINCAFSGKRPVICGELKDIGNYDNGIRMVSTGASYAYLRISEGCDNHCTYCTIPSLRGPFRSRKMEDIITEALYLAEAGIKEIVIIAQDTTRYGVDIYKEKKLVDLLRLLSKIDGIEWIRLLYCYPDEIDKTLVDEIARNKKICKYLDIPIQHISSSVLKRMGRKGDSSRITGLITELRNSIPDIVLRTTLIVGFPGETKDDFNLLYDFVENYRFDRLGVFMYSKEDGTPSAKMQNQIPYRIKKMRYDKVMKLQQGISAEINSSRVSGKYQVLVEGITKDGELFYGRSYAEAPEIDGVIFFRSEGELLSGSFTDVEVQQFDRYDLIGEAIK